VKEVVHLFVDDLESSLSLFIQKLLLLVFILLEVLDVHFVFMFVVVAVLPGQVIFSLKVVVGSAVFLDVDSQGLEALEVIGLVCGVEYVEINVAIREEVVKLGALFVFLEDLDSVSLVITVFDGLGVGLRSPRVEKVLRLK
jgi:hypothetical protein